MSRPHTVSADRPPFFDAETVRLAINENGRQIYLAQGAPEHADDVCVFVEGPNGGAGSFHPRSVLRTKGATIQTSSSSLEAGVVVCGAVSDRVSAVSVDGVEAILRNNAYLAVVSSHPASIVVTTPDGERRVDAPNRRPRHG